jgi:hypothetical protein
LCTYLKANIGALYLLDETEKLVLSGKFVLHPQKHKEYFKLNGLIGQAAWEQNKLFYTTTDDQIVLLLQY